MAPLLLPDFDGVLNAILINHNSPSRDPVSDFREFKV